MEDEAYRPSLGTKCPRVALVRPRATGGCVVLRFLGAGRFGQASWCDSCEICEPCVTIRVNCANRVIRKMPYGLKLRLSGRFD